MARKQIPAAVEAAVLLKSVRRCALCFLLARDLSEKVGQIAHLDKDPSNSAEENLAFMCLPHHSLFDSTTSQHKNYTVLEVKAARTALHEAITRGEHASQARSVESGYSSAALMALIREVTIPAKAVPINLGPGPIISPLLPIPSSQQTLFYGLMQDLARKAFEPLPQFVGLPESDRPTDERSGARFLVELFQYVLFKSIDLLQHSSTEFVAGTHRTATVPPEAVVYPPADVSAVVRANRFSTIGQEAIMWTSGWQVRLPRDSRILFSQHDGDSPVAPTYVVEFSNPLLYVLRVSAHVGVTYDYPRHADMAKCVSVVKAYEVTVRGRFEFMRRRGADPFQQKEYERWAADLFGGLEQMISG